MRQSLGVDSHKRIRFNANHIYSRFLVGPYVLLAGFSYNGIGNEMSV